MADPVPTPRRKKPLSYLGVMGWCVLFGLIVGGLSGLINTFGGDLAGPLRALLLTITIVFVIGITVVWWRGVDEAVRESHKWAWYWGGSVGTALGMVVFALLAWEADVAALPDIPPADAMMGGMALILGLQLIGYTVAWAAWWLRRR